MSSPASTTTPPPNSTAATMSTSDAEYVSRGAGRGSNMGLMIAIVVLIIVVAVVGAGLATNWYGTQNSSKPANTTFPTCGSSVSPVTISAAGSTFVYPLANFWGVQYNHYTGCVQFSENPIGSGAGISQLTKKLVYIGCSDAPFNPAQRAGFGGTTVLTIPWGLGAVSVEYNTGVAGIGLNLSAQVVADIFLKKITVWNDPAILALNPGAPLPSTPIQPVHRSDGSGTTYVFTTWLFLSSQDWRSSGLGHNQTVTWPTGELAQSGSSAVTATVASTAGAIGYAELNYAKTGGTHVTYAAVQSPSGQFILPNTTNTAMAAQSVAPSLPAASGDWGNVTILNQPNGAYPLATFTYAMVYEDLGSAYASLAKSDAQWVVHFLWWAVDPAGGQLYSSGAFFVPLPSAVTAEDQTAIKAIVYNGATLQTP